LNSIDARLAVDVACLFAVYTETPRDNLSLRNHGRLDLGFRGQSRLYRVLYFFGWKGGIWHCDLS
jgi:hypothetical protein